MGLLSVPFNQHASLLRLWLAENAQQYAGSPSHLARLATSDLRFPVTRQDIHRAAVQLGLSLKKQSPVPGFARDYEREQYKNDLAMLGVSTRMCVFVDDKKFRAEESTKRWASYGYSVVGTRLPRRCVLAKFYLPTNATQASASNSRYTIS